MLTRTRFQIATNAYEKPYVSDGTREETDSLIIYKWKEISSDSSEPADYVLTYYKLERKVEIQRTGTDVQSSLTFVASQTTKAHYSTPYGEMEIGIETDYINTPNLMSPRFEISYRLEEGSDLNRNCFIISEIE